MARRKKPKEFDPFSSPEQFVQDDRVDRLTDMLKRVLLATRARAVAGFKPLRCLACDRPHPSGRCQHDCIHHKAVALLKELDIDVEGMA